jgi:TonB family protein
MVSALSAFGLSALATPGMAQEAPATRLVQAPSLAELVDTATLRIALAARAPLPDRRAARVVYILADSVGSTPRVLFAVPLLLEPALVDSLSAMIRAHVRPTTAAGVRARTALLINTGVGASIERVSITEELPSVRDLPGFRRRLGDFADRLVREDVSLVGRELEVRIRLWISEEGEIRADSLVRSTGRAAADSAAVRLARTVRFTPGKFEGEIVPMYVILPIRFIFPD